VETNLLKIWSYWNHWRSQKFWLGRPKMETICDVILVTSFGWRFGDDVMDWFLKCDFVTISLKIHNLVKSR